jgi:uncharacterized integral membrane protein
VNAPDRQAGQREESRWRRWGLTVAGILLVLFMALNSQDVEVNLIVGSAQMPLIFALAIAAVLGAIVGWVVQLTRRPDR